MACPVTGENIVLGDTSLYFASLVNLFSYDRMIISPRI